MNCSCRLRRAQNQEEGARIVIGHRGQVYRKMGNVVWRLASESQKPLRAITEACVTYEVVDNLWRALCKTRCLSLHAVFIMSLETRCSPNQIIYQLLFKCTGMPFFISFSSLTPSSGVSYNNRTASGSYWTEFYRRNLETYLIIHVVLSLHWHLRKTLVKWKATPKSNELIYLS